jgi:hypothetical protein
MTHQDKKELDFVLKQATKILIGAIVLALVLISIIVYKL